MRLRERRRPGRIAPTAGSLAARVTSGTVPAARTGAGGTVPPTNAGLPRLISPQDVTDRIAWIQPQWEVLSLAFPDSAALNGQALYGTQFRGDEYVEWVRYAEQNYPVHPAPVVSLPVPERNRSWGAINGDWNNALPKILVASPDEFDALWDAAVKAFRDNGGDAIAAEAVANYQQWTSQ